MWYLCMYEGEYINSILHDWLGMIEIDMGRLCVHVYVTNKMLDFTHQCRTGNFIWYHHDHSSSKRHQSNWIIRGDDLGDTNVNI